jgi:hypothetical protein
MTPSALKARAEEHRPQCDNTFITSVRLELCVELTPLLTSAFPLEFLSNTCVTLNQAATSLRFTNGQFEG